MPPTLPLVFGAVCCVQVIRAHVHVRMYLWACFLTFTPVLCALRACGVSKYVYVHACASVLLHVCFKLVLACLCAYGVSKYEYV